MIPHIFIVLLSIFLAGCQSKPFPADGEIVLPPWGYVDMCIREPESIFCEHDPASPQ